MSKHPDYLDLNHTSFRAKEPYKPPSNAFFSQKDAPKKPKYVIGGEFADDGQQVTPEAQPQLTPQTAFAERPAEKAERKQESKFGWLNKHKDKNGQESRKTNAVGVFEFAEVRSEKQLPHQRLRAEAHPGHHQAGRSHQKAPGSRAPQLRRGHRQPGRTPGVLGVLLRAPGAGHGADFEAGELTSDRCTASRRY